MVYLFLTPLQQNSGHYIPYITCFFPQPEKPKSRVPSFLENLATLIFTGLPLLGLSAAKLIHFVAQNTSSQELAPDKNIPAAFYTTAFLQRPLHPIHNLFLPTARKAQKESPFFSRKIGNSTFHWFTSSGPLYSKTYSLHNPKHVIPSTCTRQEYSSSLLHQSLFAPIFTRHLLHQTPFIPGTSSPETF